MSKNKWDPPTQDDVNRLIAGLREIEKDIRGASREATEFKPGELTPEEEEFVRREGLNALNYVPQKTLKKHSAAFQKYEEKIPKRTEVMSRPKTDPERVQIEREERAQNLRKRLDDRFDGFAYGMFLLVIFGFTVLLIDSYGWPMGIFSGLLMFDARTHLSLVCTPLTLPADCIWAAKDFKHALKPYRRRNEPRISKRR